MPDTSDHRECGTHHGRAAADWHAAFSALPPETPPTDGWSRLAAALDAPSLSEHPATRLPPRRVSRRPSRLTWLATAAALLLAVALPWRLLHIQQPDPAGSSPVAANPVATTPATGASDVDAPATLPSMQALYAESAQLEALLAYVRDDRVSSGTAAVLGEQLDIRIAAIDAALMRPGLSAGHEHILWHERVLALRALVSFQSNRRWLAVSGERYDGTLVRVD